MTYRTLNPATEELIQEYPELPWEGVSKVVEKSDETFQIWRGAPFSQRKKLFLRLAEKLKEGREQFARLMTQEMGKTIVEAEVEIDKCAQGCQFFAENAEKFLQPETIPTEATKSYVRYDPLGVILAIMPWNYPFWQVFRCAAPAIMAGNAVILKHAPNVPGCALAIAQLFRDAGFPEGIFQSIFCSNEVAARLIQSPIIRGVSLTGSDRAGSQVGEVAGGAIKKAVLELGGSDPLIVFADADLEKCIPAAVRSRVMNCGQVCISAKRFIVVKEIAKEFEKLFVKTVVSLKVGDPMDRSTQVGPMAREDLLSNLARQVKETTKQGAACLTGGNPLKRTGFFFQPTVLKDVRPGMTAFDEETFGPVASLVVARDEEEAIELANRTVYGLGASLWTADLQKGERFAERIEAGSIFINGTVKSDVRLPFGGIKRSGYGRELSAVGIREFTNVKTVWIT